MSDTVTGAAHTAGPLRIEGPDPFGDYNILHPADSLAVAAVVSNMRPPEVVEMSARLFAASFTSYGRHFGPHAVSAAEGDLLGLALEALRETQKLLGLLTPDLIGEGVHAGLRKGTDAPSARNIYDAISSSEDAAWGEACSWAIDPIFSMWGGNELLARIAVILSQAREVK